MNISTNADKVFNYNYMMRSLTCQDPNYTELNESGVSTHVYDDLSNFITNKLNLVTDIFKNSMIKYLDNSIKLNDLENLNATSDKLEKLQTNKLDELKDNLNQLHNTQYNSIIDYYIKNYNENKNAFLINVFLHITIMSSLIFTLAYSKITNFNTYFITILSFYVIFIILNFRQNMYRKYNDWNKFYFIAYKNPKKV